MPIIPYRQSLTHSCLAASFLMLLNERKNVDFDECAEQELTMKGSQRMYPLYVVGIPLEFAKKFDTLFRVVADNKYFTDVLKKSFQKERRISVEHQKVTISLIRKMVKSQPVICHIDDHFLGDFSHASHFVVLEKELPKDRVLVIDPWTGKQKRLAFAKLEESIDSLKTHIKMCPLLFTIG